MNLKIECTNTMNVSAQLMQYYDQDNYGKDNYGKDACDKVFVKNPIRIYNLNIE